MKKYYVIFIILIAGALTAAYFFRLGWYPLAMVDSKLVWGWQLEKEIQAAVAYYNQAIETYNVSVVDSQEKRQLEDDVRRASLEALIDKIIISNSLKSLEGDRAGTLVSEKIDKYFENDKLESAASALFNLSFRDFIEVILIPQAEKEIMEDKMKKENRDFNGWLKIQRERVKVHIFVRDFKWTSGGVKRD